MALLEVQNLKKSFAANKDVDLRGKNVLLIDDVITTGSTANECSKKLKEAGYTNACQIFLGIYRKENDTLSLYPNR